jgi:nucleoid-associated protein YgaU
VAAVVVPVPGPATPTAPAVPQGEDPSSAEVEAPPAEPAEDTPPPTASTETGDVPDVDPVVAPALEPAAPPESIDQEDAGSALAEAEAIPTEPAEETPSSTARSETGDAPEVDPVVAAAPEPAAPPVPVEQEDARPALAEAEATPAEPREDTPPPTAESETGDDPEVDPVVAAAPEPAAAPDPAVPQDGDPPSAESEATPAEPGEDTPSATAGSDTGDVPDVAAVVVPVPEPATPPALAVPQDEEPALAEGEATPAELAKVSASAPSTDGSERTADQEEPVTTPVSEAQSADVAATEQAVSPESPDIAPAVPADGPGPDDGASTEAPAAQQVAALPEAPADATAPDPAGAAAPEESLPAPESMAPPTPEDVAQFDVVQVSPDGTVVVAGRTVPGSQVELVVDGEVIATADTNRNGEFVFVPDVQLLPGVRELSIAVLSPDVPDRRTASRIVVVLIPDREMLAARVTEPTESAPSEAPIALLIDEQGETVGVIQPSPSMADPDTVLSLTTVTFDEDGYASITGGGEAGQKVTVYLDNEATGSTIIGENGYWTVRTQHPLAKTGSYKVRIDQTAPNDDTVTERIVTTLIRAGGKLIPAAATVVTVVKGNTLWGISRRHYGRGILYTLIYDSNSYQIADPHWIYPGQKFLIPKRN